MSLRSGLTTYATSSSLLHTIKQIVLEKKQPETEMKNMLSKWNWSWNLNIDLWFLGLS